MDPRPTADETPARRWFLLLLLCAVPVFAVRLGAKDAWEASEGRPLQSAREMRLRGDWLVQYTNGQVDLTKPPLYAWATGAAFAIAGRDSEAAGRVPSVLASLGVLGAVFVLARRVAGPRAGFLAGLALATTAKFLWQARLAELETLLALGTTWAYVAFGAYLEEERRGRRWALAAAFHAATGLAFAVKGPIALLLVLPGAAAHALLSRRGRALLAAPLLATVPVLAATGLAWYVAVVLRDPSALDTFLSYARGDNVGHRRDVAYYLVEYPLYALPWTPLVGAGLSMRFARGLPERARRRARLALDAFVATFVVQSFLSAKQTHYLIPVVFPMGAVLAGLVLDRWLARRAAVTGPGLAWGADPARGGLWGRVVARRRGAGGAASAALVLLLALEGYGAGWIVPRWNAEMSARPFLERAAARIPEGAALAWSIFGSHSDYLWYLPMSLVGRDGIPEILGATEAEAVERLRSFLAAGPSRYALVFGAQADALGASAEVLERDDAFQKKGRRVALVRGVAR